MEERIMCAMAEYFGTDVRRVNHALKVHAFAAMIADGEKITGFDRRTLGLAAVLHDIGIRNAEVKYGSHDGRLQETEGPPVAAALLAPLALDSKIVDRVLFLIGHHHSYGFIDGPDFQILVEADCLVNLFEDGLSREAAETARDKVFRTGTGTRLLQTLYQP
jgi:hypothetical protein